MNKKYLFILPVVLAVFIISNSLITTQKAETISVFKLQSLASALTSLQEFLALDTNTAIEPLGCKLNTDTNSVVKGEKFKLSWTTTGADRVVLVNNRGYKKEGLKLNRKAFRIGTAKKKAGNIRYTLRTYDEQGNRKICKQTIAIVPEEVVNPPSAISDSTNLSWNSLGESYQYSLDVKPAGKGWVGPCVDAGVLKSKNKYTYQGVCTSASNKSVPKEQVEKFRLCYTKGQWGDGTEKCKVLNNDLEKDSLNFKLVPPASVNLMWNLLDTQYQYSLDVKPEGKGWIGPCVNAGVLQNKSSYTYDGSCVSAEKAVDKNIPAEKIEKFRLCYTKDAWGGDTTKCKVLNNDGEKSSLNFKLIPPSLPPTCTLSIEPATIIAGDELLLSWTTENSVSAVLTNDIGLNESVSLKSGTSSFDTIGLGGNTIDYKLTAKNKDNKSVVCTKSVSVESPPVNCIFNDSVIIDGESVTAYKKTVPTLGSSCAKISKSFVCNNGVLDNIETYPESVCSENPVISPDSPRRGTKGADTAITTLTDGTMLMIQSTAGRLYNKSDEFLTYKVFVLESKDNGKTWKNKSVAAEYKETAAFGYGHKKFTKIWGVTNPYSIMQTKSGRIIAAYKYRKYKKGGNSATHYIETIYSDDKGKTWNSLGSVYSRKVLDSQIEVGGLWEPYVFEPSNRPNVLQVYFARERPQRESCPGLAGKGQDIVMSESIDGGKTWGEPRTILRNGRSREGMPSVVELPGGRLVLGHEHARYPSCSTTKPQSGFVPASAISDDGGKTWTDSTAYKPANDLVRSGWVFMQKLTDGRLALRFSKEVKPNSETRYSQLLLTKNIPTSTNPPIWDTKPIKTMNGVIQWGTLGQAQNGDIIVTGAPSSNMKQMYRVIPYSSLPKPPTTVKLNWNLLGAQYKYSLDVRPEGKKWVGPCAGASILGQAGEYTYDGSCPDAKSSVNKTIPKEEVNKFRLCYTKGQWGDGTEKCKVINNDVEKNSLSFTLEIPKADKPNVLFILLDDAGYDDFTNASVIKPNIEKFASESTRFEQFYTNPMCTPTRMSLLSGNYAMKYGIPWVCGSDAVYGIPSNNVTLPETLSMFGYKTSTFGKWHAGKGREQYEALSKFDYSVLSEGPVKNGYFDPVYFIDGVKQKPLVGNNLTNATADYVIKQMKEKSIEDKPFFINYWLNAPHGPYQPTLKWAKEYIPEIKTGADYFKTDASGKLTTDILDKWKKRKYKPVLYKALFSQADENIGRVLDVIDSDPYLKKNTIVIIVSDNGGTEVTHPDGNGPLRGFKTDVFEGGTRLPFFIRWPENIEAGVTDTSIVSVEDVYSTVMELVGGTAPENIAGNSFATIARNEKSNVPRKEPLFRAHKVFNEFLKETDSLYDYDLMSYSVRDGKWKLVYEPLDRKKAYLFNMSACAAEGSAGKSCEEDTDDVSSKNPKRFDNMKQMYRDWLFDTTKIPLKFNTLTGKAKKASTTYTFTGKGGSVKFKNRLDFDITRLDATFIARVTPKGRDGTVRVIARREGSWTLRINKENKLELQIVGTNNRRELVVGTQELKVGKTYDVAFTLYSFKSRNTVAKIYTRDVNEGGRMKRNVQAEVPPLLSNSNTVTLGAGKNNKLNPFIGIIESPKMFKAPLSVGQIEDVMGIDISIKPTIYQQNPVVWKPDSKGKWLRDPNLHKTSTGTYIMSGTVKYVVEYENNDTKSLTFENGSAYNTELFSPDGTRHLRRNGFSEWGKKFLQTDGGLVLIASLPTVANFNTGKSENAGRRSTYLFEPITNGAETKSGFPLKWKLKSNTPLVAGVYSTDPFIDSDGSIYLLEDVRKDKKYNTTCILSQKFDSSTYQLGEENILLCPGKKVKKSKDSTGWARNNPMPSEVRFEDGGGLLEGAWGYKSTNGKYYLTYSSGDYDSGELYGGFVAECDSITGPCRKTMNGSKTESRLFLDGNSENYTRVGRPFPVVDDTGKLTDIIFHARKNGDNKDTILRCTNFTPTILEDFVAGGEGCEYDNQTGSVLGVSTTVFSTTGLVANVIAAARSVVDMLKNLLK